MSQPEPPPVVRAQPVPPRVASFITLVGVAAAAVGAFALPLQNGNRFTDDVGFVAVRQAAAQLGDHRLAFPGGRGGGSFTSAFGEVWWRFGLFLTLALLLAGLCALIFGTVVRGAGAAIVGIGILALAGQGAALAQTSSRPFQAQGSAVGSLYDGAGPGIWVAYAGLFVVVAGGLVAVLTGRRRAG